MKILVFAEKPSVGRDVARVLGATRHGQGFLEGDKYVVTWGFGHLVALAHPDAQNPAWKRWSLSSLPMLPENWVLSVLPTSKEQFENVSRLFNRGDISEVVNGADAGREGELIFRLVYRQSGCNKPIKRLWISSMTDEAIKKGFEDLKPGENYESLARAALCRSRADWLVGMNLTRAYTCKYNEKYTVGRVQTPTLAMVVGRHKEIQSFVPKDYWELNAIFNDFSALWFNPKASENPSRLETIEQAKTLSERIKGKTASVLSVKKTQKKLSPPSLYDLTTLQRDANARFSMTAAETLSALQTLYEKYKVVTYPRTDSRYLSDDIFKTIERRLAALDASYGQYLEYLREHRPTKDKRVFNNAKVSDHHAVIPTEKKAVGVSAWPLHLRRIYDLVVRRFIAVFYPDHLYLSTTITLQCEKERFKALGKVITQEGWKQLYRRTEQKEKSQSSLNDGAEAEQTLPELKKGDTRVVENAEILAKKTKPPAAYTEAALLQSMETAGKLVESEELRDAMKESGLGTPATRAEIIEKLIRVEYMFRDKKKLVPTPKGIKLIELAASEIKSPTLTGSWEKRLADIAKVGADDKAFMKDISTFVSEVVLNIKQSKNVPAKRLAAPLADRPSFGVCPACGKGKIIEGKRGFGCDRFKEGCHYVVWKEFYKKKLSQSTIDTLIKGKTTRLLKGFVLENGEVVSGRIGMKSDKSGIELLSADAKTKPTR